MSKLTFFENHCWIDFYFTPILQKRELNFSYKLEKWIENIKIEVENGYQISLSIF